MNPLLVLLVLGGQTPPPKVNTPVPVMPAPVRLQAPQGAEKRILSLRDALAIAVMRSPDLKSSLEEIRASEGRRIASRAGLGPQVDLSADYTKTDRIGSGGGSVGGDPYSGDVQLSQLLFDFDKTRASAKRAASLVEAAVLAHDALVGRLARDLLLAGHSQAEADGVLEIRKSDVAVRQRQLDLAQSRLDDGLGAPGDVVRARASLARAMADLVSAQSGSFVALTNINQLLGTDPRTPLTLSLTDRANVSSAEDLQVLMDEAMKARPETLQAIKLLESSRFALSAAEKGSAPSLSARIRVAGSGAKNPAESGTSAYGVQVSWPLFDSGRTRGQVMEAKASVSQSQNDLEQVRLSISQQVVQAWLEIQTLQAQLQLLKTAEDNASEAARIAEGKYRDGIGTFLEITDAQAALLQAQLSRTSTEASLGRAQAQLEWARGALTPDKP